MKITKNIYLKNFKYKTSKNKILKLFKKLLRENNPVLYSMTKNYDDNFRTKDLSIFNKRN